MEDIERVTIRLSGVLARIFRHEALEAGLDLSKYLRRLMLASRPHLAAFEDIAKINAASEAITDPKEYLPFVLTKKARLEAALRELESFEAQAAGWREEAARDLKMGLGKIEEQLAQARMLTNLDQVTKYGKLFEAPEEDTHEGR